MDELKAELLPEIAALDVPVVDAELALALAEMLEAALEAAPAVVDTELTAELLADLPVELADELTADEALKNPTSRCPKRSPDAVRAVPAVRAFRRQEPTPPAATWGLRRRYSVVLCTSSR